MQIVGNCIIHYEDTKGKVIVAAGTFAVLFNNIELLTESAKAVAAQHDAKGIEYWAGGTLITASHAVALSSSVDASAEN